MSCIIPAGIDAVAIFGSAARRDYDALSDLDLLVVAEQPAVVNRACDSLDKLGWSCTPYTWGRLRKCISAGSLFAIHLRKEALIIRDKSHHLKDVLRACKHRSEGYRAEYREACSLIQGLEAIPVDGPGLAWVLDMLTVGFRSAAIARLADAGVYVFSFEEILAHMCRFGFLTYRDARRLRNLRWFKAAYRVGLRTKIPTFDEVRRFIDVTSACFNIGLHVRPFADGEAFDRILGNREGSSDWYQRTRRAELAVQGLLPIGKDSEEFFAAKRAILKILRKPTQYGWFMKAQWPLIHEKIVELQSYSVM